MAIDTISRFIVKVDNCVDYIPFISAVNNGAILASKIALSIFSSYCPSAYEKIRKNALIKHITADKHVFECILLIFPFINILIALGRNHPNAGKKAPDSPRGPQPQPQSTDQRIAALQAQADNQLKTAALIAQGRRGLEEYKQDTEDLQKMLEASHTRDAAGLAQLQRRIK